MYLELYSKYEQYIDYFMIFLFLTVIVGIGMMTRDLFDNRVKYSFKMTFFGAMFFSIMLTATAIVSKMHFAILIIPALLSGFKCNELIARYKKDKDLDKYDPLTKFNYFERNDKDGKN